MTGIGPGTYEYFYAREGGGQQFVRDAHSIYLEALAEMGPLGLILVLALILGPLGLAVALALRRGLDERRGLIAAAGAGMAAFAVGAGIDWAWEVTVLPVMFFVLAAAVLGRYAASDEPDEVLARNVPAPGLGRPHPGGRCRAVVMIVLIGVPLIATQDYRSSQASVRAGDLQTALDAGRIRFGPPAVLGFGQGPDRAGPPTHGPGPRGDRLRPRSDGGGVRQLAELVRPRTDPRGFLAAGIRRGLPEGA